MKCLPLATRSMVTVLLFACASAASAVSRDITAVFRPDPSKPHENIFTNTTPVSGHCSQYGCGSTVFSIRLPLVFDSTAPIQASHSDPRQGAMFSMPIGWRTAQVTHASTGESETVEIRWVGMGSQYQIPSGVIELVGGGVDIGTAHARLWNGRSWGYAPEPCRQAPVTAAGTNFRFAFFWFAPDSEGVCAKQASYLIPGMSYSYLDFAYEMRTPNPLGMSSGQYTGALVYSVGPGQDIDMGDVMLPNDSTLSLHFKLDVEHTLKVDLVPGGDRVELVPQEGWQAWLNSGSRPSRLFRDQRFHISASSRFKMWLECQIVSGNTCAISEAGTGHAVPVDVSVSLHNGLTDAVGQPVERRRVLRDGSGTELFRPVSYIDRGLGTLHFEVGRESVADMLDSGGNRYTGNVTVIWDSEV